MLRMSFAVGQSIPRAEDGIYHDWNPGFAAGGLGDGNVAAHVGK
jgi:hypothetical protein